jgi:hypothetical protein
VPTSALNAMSISNAIALTPEHERLALAISDMRHAAAAARLLDKQDDFHARRALETAISVSYARPWLASNRSGKLKAKWLPAAGPDRDLHNRLLDLRHKTYAHTDPAGGRSGLAHVGPDNVLGIGEQWIPLDAKDLPAIADLCDRQAERFQQALVDEIDAANPA